MGFWRTAAVSWALLVLAPITSQGAEAVAGWRSSGHVFGAHRDTTEARQYPRSPDADCGPKRPHLSALPPGPDSSTRMMSRTEKEGHTPKRARQAFFLSLLLPGAGHYYVHAPRNARAFLEVESALWATFLGFRAYGSWREADYRSFAVLHAKANPSSTWRTWAPIRAHRNTIGSPFGGTGPQPFSTKGTKHGSGRVNPLVWSTGHCAQVACGRTPGPPMSSEGSCSIESSALSTLHTQRVRRAEGRGSRRGTRVFAW
jgi:hypothetical protein